MDVNDFCAKLRRLATELENLRDIKQSEEVTIVVDLGAGRLTHQNFLVIPENVRMCVETGPFNRLHFHIS